MRAADLDNLVECLSLLVQGISEVLQGREKHLLDVENGGDMHDGWEGIVGASGHVDVVVGVDWLLAAHLSAEDLDCSVGDDFVGVHVGLGAGAGLPDDEREVVNELEGCDLFSGFDDCVADLGIWGVVSSWSAVVSPYQPRPYFMFTLAAAPFRMPKAFTTPSGIRS